MDEDDTDVESQYTSSGVEGDEDDVDELEVEDLDADSDRLGWRRIFQLPFQPIWHYSILIIASFQTYLAIYQAGVKVYGKKDGLIDSEFTVFKYSSDLMYAIDILLIIGCRNLHGLQISPLAIRRPNLVLAADVVSIIPGQLFIPMDPLTPFRAKFYYILHLFSCFKIARIYNTLYYNRNTVGTSKLYLQIFDFYFSIGLAVMVGFVLTYHIICADSGCNGVLSSEDYFRLLYISVSRITARGLAVYPTETYWILCISIMGLAVFAAVICTSIAYVTIALYTLLHHKYEFFNQLKLIHHELERPHVPKDIAENCMEFFDMFWKRCNGYNDHSTYYLEVLPQSTYEEICLDASWYALKHSKLLRNMDIPFLRQVSVCIKSKFVLPGEIIYDRHTTKNMMIYVVLGVIQIISLEDDETPILSFSAGTCLGESSLILNYKPKGIVRSKTFCKLHVLETKEFVKLIKIFPEHFHKMRIDFKRKLRMAAKYHELSKLVNFHYGVKERTDHITIMWLKSTLDRLMQKEEKDMSSLHECHNIFMRDEFNQERFINRHFTAKNLDMLVISEELELVTDTVFLKNTCPCILQPDSILLNTWEGIIAALAIVTAFMAPYFAFVEPSTPLWYEVVIYIVTIFWIMDLYIQISTADKTSEEIKATLKQIFLFRKSSVPLLVTLACALPVELLSSIILEKLSPQHRALLYLNRALKIWQVRRIFLRWENKLHADLILICYFKYCSVLCYAAYVSACALFALNCFNFVCVSAGTDSTAVQLVRCLEASVTILTGVCISSRLTTKRTYYFFYLLLNLLSTIFFVFTHGKLAAEYALKRANRITLSEMLTDLCSILKTTGLMEKYNKRIFAYVKTQLVDNNAATLIHTQSIFSDLPLHIYQALRETTHKDIILNAPLFEDLPEEAILDICSAVRDVILPPNEVVCYTGEICDTFYIISKGYCRIISDSANKEQRTLGPMESISAMESCVLVPTINTVITVTHCRLVAIDHHTLNQIYLKYPVHRAELQIALDGAEVKSELGRLFRSRSVSDRYAIIAEKENNSSFHRFGYNLRVDSFEEYDYYIPFDRLGLLSFVQYFLLRCTVLPESKFIFMWETFRCIFAVLSAILFPINSIGICAGCSWYFIRALLDGMAWIDIYLRFHVCYYNENGILVTHPWKTAIHYFKHGLLVDLCGVFPSHLCFPNEMLAVLQLNRVLQMHRYFGFMNYIEEASLLPTTTLSILKYFPTILVLCSCCGSAMINLICDFGINVEESDEFTKGVKCWTRSWITQSLFVKPLSPDRVQAYAVYFTTSILTMSGMMGFSVHSTLNGVLTMVLSIVAFILSAHLVSKAISLYTVGDSTLLAYQGSMKSVLTYMRNNKVNPDFQQALLDHYELKWRRKQGRDIRESISTFSRSLQQDILYDIYGRTLQETSVFITDSRAFLRNLLLEMHHDVNMKNTYITSVNSVTRYLYILFKGQAGVVAPDSSKLAILTPGSMFGNLDNYDMVRQTVSVVAIGHVEILSIESLRFHAILKNYPLAQKRYEFMTALHADYLEGRGRVAQEDEVSCSTNSRLLAHWSLTKNPFAVLQYVFNPKNMFIRIWDIIILVGVCYIEVCFDLYQMAMAEYNLGFIVAQYVCDFLYVVDYFVKTHTAFENDAGLVITDLQVIRQRFMQDRVIFWITVISTIPLDVFVWFAPSTVFQFLHPILRLNRLLRFTYVLRHFKRQKQKLTLNLWVWRFTFIMLWLTFILHSCTCILITLSRLHTPNMHPNIDFDWITTSSYKNTLIYTNYYYLVLSCFIRASQNRVYPQSLALTIYCILLMIFMLHLNAIFIAQVYTTLQMTFHRQNLFAQKLERISNYMQRENLSDSIIMKAYGYMRFLWNQKRGTIFPRLLQEAPPNMRELILNSAFGHHINNHFVFKKCHVDFNRQLVACLKNKTYFKDDYIVFKGTINKSMYFVHTGNVVALMEDNLLGETIVAKFQSGTCFGVTQGLFPEKPYSYTFRATKTTVILCLYLDTWQHLLRFFPATNTVILETYAQYEDKYA